MNHPRENPGASSRRARWITAGTCWLVAVAVLAVGCERHEDKPMKQTMPEASNLDTSGHVRKGRPLSQVELDTLRVMKQRLRITRDQYWDNVGGVLGNDFLEVWYPPGNLTVTHGMYAFNLIAGARRTVRGLFGRVPLDTLVVVCSESMPKYTEKTGRQWWNYSLMQDDHIVYQPVFVLAVRGLGEIAIPHEYYRWAIKKLSGGRAPHWLEQGLASVLSFESHILVDQLKEFPNDPVKMSPQDIEKALAADNDKKSSRIAYYDAYRMVDRMITLHGREAVAQMVNALGDGVTLDGAAHRAFGESYDDAMDEATGWKPGDTQ